MKIEIAISRKPIVLFEVTEDEIEKVEGIIVDIMVNAVQLDVPLVVDTGIGINWDEAY